MPRYKLTLEYDGSPYYGWQYQEGLPTVQGALEQAIEALCGEPCRTFVAGRTDAGVHALQQVAHFDSPKDYAPERVMGALNYYLHKNPLPLEEGLVRGISVLQAEIVSDDFHARFSAKGRKYLYRILNRAAPPAIDKGRVWHVPEKLDMAMLREGAKYLIGTHDFTSFRASECQAKSPIKTLDEIIIRHPCEGRDPRLGDSRLRGNDEIWLEFAARSFLHHQVRNMVGSLKHVGKGNWTPEKIKQVLEAKDRTAAAETAPAEGLYLTEVVY